MLPTDKKARKDMPIYSGVLAYFPDAIAAVAEVSRIGNEQHNPGQPMHWAREKSADHADCIVRHLIERGTVDSDGVLHTAKLSWRALALLQIELEGAGAVEQDYQSHWLMHGFDGKEWKTSRQYTRHELEQLVSTPIRRI